MNTIYRCLVIDDEQAAHFVLKNYIARVQYLELVGQCYNVMEAIKFLNEQKVDLLFLDMNMPELSGMDMLQNFPNLPKTILTTAYKDYALLSYEFGIIDYLLKPFEFPRFLKAISRALGQTMLMPASDGNKTLTIKVNGIPKDLPVHNMVYVQGMGNYVQFVFDGGESVLSLITLSKIEEELPKSLFLRVHKSYVINKKMIDRITVGVVRLNSGVDIPIGITYRRKLMDLRKGL